jgi:hypothetical protein
MASPRDGGPGRHGPLERQTPSRRGDRGSRRQDPLRGVDQPTGPAGSRTLCGARGHRRPLRIRIQESEAPCDCRTSPDRRISPVRAMPSGPSRVRPGCRDPLGYRLRGTRPVRLAPAAARSFRRLPQGPVQLKTHPQTAPERRARGPGGLGPPFPKCRPLIFMSFESFCLDPGNGALLVSARGAGRMPAEW